MITGYFGLPGSGKSTFLAMLASKAQNKGNVVFVNEDFPIAGCYLYNFTDLGKYDIRDGLVLMDEISLDADNRDFKTFSKRSKEFFALHRHFGLDIVWATQTFDGADKKIKNLTQLLYYIRPIGGISMAVQVASIMMIPTKHNLKAMAQDIFQTHVKPGFFRLLLFPFNGTVKFCRRKKYYHLFDSFCVPEYPKIHLPYYDGERILYAGDEGYPYLYDPSDKTVHIRKKAAALA